MHITPEEFHLFALQEHLNEVTRLTASGVDANDQRLRLAVCDALSWAFRLHHDVRGGMTNAPASPQWFKDFVKGATWARHRIIHGHESILRFDMVTEIDSINYNDPIAYDDPDLTYQGELAQYQAVVFMEAPQSVAEVFPGGRDDHETKRDQYNAQVAGRRVAEVCGILDADPAKL